MFLATLDTKCTSYNVEVSVNAVRILIGRLFVELNNAWRHALNQRLLLTIVSGRPRFSRVVLPETQSFRQNLAVHGRGFLGSNGRNACGRSLDGRRFQVWNSCVILKGRRRNRLGRRRLGSSWKPELGAQALFGTSHGVPLVFDIIIRAAGKHFRHGTPSII